MQLDGDSREEVAAHRGGAGKNDLGLVLPYEIGERAAVGLAAVVGEFGRVDLDDLVDGKLQQPLAHLVELVPEDHQRERDAEHVGELPALARELHRHALYTPAPLLAEDPDAPVLREVDRGRGGLLLLDLERP